jgi:hypothetical protein
MENSIQQERTMKLTTPWVDQTQMQFDLRALPENHPATEKLHEVFGVHTFFVGDEGLHIVEEIDLPQVESGAKGILKLASWRDDQHRALEVHEPEMVGIVVATETDGNGRARQNKDHDNR